MNTLNKLPYLTNGEGLFHHSPIKKETCAWLLLKKEVGMLVIKETKMKAQFNPFFKWGRQDCI